MVSPLGLTLFALNNLSRQATHNRFTAWVCWIVRRGDG